ncbi:unnamed protein product [Allacma fusca]|uniref:Lipocalin/cytosolic fatty-acid binding domain-containing protein n=1 Tax=Allacma fusca TaxID=39272 RepID=A0A8J2LKN0_9HEXA|nr:unnamed protein product [Allacma fusca]
MTSKSLADIVGNYNMVSHSDNFEDYLKKLDVNFLIRKVVMNSNTFVEITHEQHEDKYTQKQKVGPKTVVFSYKLGVPFDEETLDGRKCKSLMISIPAKEGELAVQHEQNWKGKKVTITYEFREDTVTTTFKFEGVTVSQVYKRIPNQ